MKVLPSFLLPVCVCVPSVAVSGRASHPLKGAGIFLNEKSSFHLLNWPDILKCLVFSGLFGCNQFLKFKELDVSLGCLFETLRIGGS